MHWYTQVITHTFLDSNFLNVFLSFNTTFTKLHLLISQSPNTIRFLYKILKPNLFLAIPYIPQYICLIVHCHNNNMLTHSSYIQCIQHSLLNYLSNQAISSHIMFILTPLIIKKTTLKFYLVISSSESNFFLRQVLVGACEGFEIIVACIDHTNKVVFR